MRGKTVCAWPGIRMVLIVLGLIVCHTGVLAQSGTSFPAARLLLGQDGNLYGTTEGGLWDDGAVFKITPQGEFTILHQFSFFAAKGGYDADGGLILGQDGNFYGTTSEGGADINVYGGLIVGAGTVYRISPEGQFTLLHDLNGGSSGILPVCDLCLAGNGDFYGTSSSGGLYGDGIVFKFTPSGTFTAVYPFYAGPDSGANPTSGLKLGLDGNLYGTTSAGGLYGHGTVYRITPSGQEALLHSFNIDDGATPQNALEVDQNGDFYGVTALGGAHGLGTIFKITTEGKFVLLHSFEGKDGSKPMGALKRDSNGDLYGTTYIGGQYGLGTIFKITPSGAFSTLHSFDSTDGKKPLAGLEVGWNGDLYGTTSAGGKNDNGTVFKITTSGTFTSIFSF
jgi:uncharacterized repeat protein (TIGR03803 family)